MTDWADEIALDLEPDAVVDDEWWNGLMAGIAQALRDERERCARIAKNMSRKADWSDDHSMAAHAADSRAEAIEKAIRGEDG